MQIIPQLLQEAGTRDELSQTPQVTRIDLRVNVHHTVARQSRQLSRHSGHRRLIGHRPDNDLTLTVQAANLRHFRLRVRTLLAAHLIDDALPLPLDVLERILLAILIRRDPTQFTTELLLTISPRLLLHAEQVARLLHLLAESLKLILTSRNSTVQKREILAIRLELPSRKVTLNARNLLQPPAVLSNSIVPKDAIELLNLPTRIADRLVVPSLSLRRRTVSRRDLIQVLLLFVELLAQQSQLVQIARVRLLAIVRHIRLERLNALQSVIHLVELIRIEPEVLTDRAQAILQPVHLGLPLDNTQLARIDRLRQTRQTLLTERTNILLRLSHKSMELLHLSRRSRQILRPTIRAELHRNLVRTHITDQLLQPRQLPLSSRRIRINLDLDTLIRKLTLEIMHTTDSVLIVSLNRHRDLLVLDDILQVLHVLLERRRIHSRSNLQLLQNTRRLTDRLIELPPKIAPEPSRIRANPNSQIANMPTGHTNPLLHLQRRQQRLRIKLINRGRRIRARHDLILVRNRPRIRLRLTRLPLRGLHRRVRQIVDSIDQISQDHRIAVIPYNALHARNFRTVNRLRIVSKPLNKIKGPPWRQIATEDPHEVKLIEMLKVRNQRPHVLVSDY